MQPNRIAAYMTAAAGLLGALAPLVADLDTSSTATLIAGLTVILGAFLTWMRGWQAHEDRQEAGAWALGLDQAAPVVEDPEADDVPLEDLPTDEEEFGGYPTTPLPDAPTASYTTPLHDGPGAQR